MKEKLKVLIKNCYNELTDPYYQAATGCLAFYLFLSVLPAATLLSQLLGVFSLSLESIREWLAINYSEVNFDAMLSSIPEGNLSALSNVMLLVVTVWSASKAQHALSNTTDYINNDYQPMDESYFKRRARAFVMIVIVLIVFVIAMIMLVYAPVVLRLLFGSSAAPLLASGIWNALRWPLMFLLYYLVIHTVYCITPFKPAKPNEVMPGALLSSIGFIVVTVAYSYSFKANSNSNIIYGSLAQIVAMLIWFWLIAWVICLGIVLNKCIKMKEAS